MYAKHTPRCLRHNHRSSALVLHAYYGVQCAIYGQPRTDIYFFVCSGFFPWGAVVATGAGVGLAAVTGALVLVVLGLDIVNGLWW